MRCGSVVGVGNARVPLRGTVAPVSRGAGVSRGRVTLIAERMAGVHVSTSASIM